MMRVDRIRARSGSCLWSADSEIPRSRAVPVVSLYADIMVMMSIRFVIMVPALVTVLVVLVVTVPDPRFE